MTATHQTELPDKIDGAVLKVAGVVVLGAVMSILDITVVNVALPTFAKEFSTPENPVSYAHVAWTVTAYTLALATVIPMSGWAANRFGTKRLYMLALLLFTMGSALCATAWTINILIAFRALQGLGGGMLMPVGMTIMTRAAGPHRMGRLMAILGVPMLLGPILGPILGGWLIQVASWHWIFLINVPIGAVALVYSLRALPKDSPEPTDSFDFLGMALMSPGLALFLFGVSSIPGEGTVNSPRVWVSMLIGALLILAFVWHSFRPEHPLLDLRLFKDRNLRICIITMFLFAAAFFGGLLLVPSYYQTVRGETPPGYRRDSWEVDVGPDDESRFERCGTAVLGWAAQRGAGIRVMPDRPVVLDETFALVLPLPIGYAIATARVIHVVKDEDTIGFAYGTLPSHPEEGEEIFLVRRRAGRVLFEVSAFSKPRDPLARLGLPVTRWLQRRTNRTYLASIQAIAITRR